MTTGTIIFIAIIVFVFWAIVAYNGLIARRNRVKEAWSDIDVQLKRRYDLIPNLIETVKGYASHEKEVFQKVTEARTKAMGAGNVKEHNEADNMLSGALKSLFAVAEAYPELKASANFSKLQDELSDTENKIQASRRFYNSNVLEYNTQIQTIPSNIVASMFKFIPETFFEVKTEQEKEVVQVKF